MNKRNKIILIIIILITIFLLFITMYKLKNNGIINDAEYFILDVSDEYIKSDINYKEKYKEYVIDNNKLINQEIIIGNDNFIFKGLFEEKEEYLYLTESFSEKSKKIVDEKIKTAVFVYNDDTDDFMYTYLITFEGNLYRIKIVGKTVEDFEVEKINNKTKFDSFVNNTDYGSYRNLNYYYICALGKDGNLYVIPNESILIPNMIFVKNEFIAYFDGKISLLDGRLFKDSQKKDYVITRIFEITENNPFKETPSTVMVTEDNKIIYIIKDKLYEYKKKIKETYYSRISDNEGIVYYTFDDGSKIELKIKFDKKIYGYIY